MGGDHLFGHARANGARHANGTAQVNGTGPANRTARANGTTVANGTSNTNGTTRTERTARANGTAGSNDTADSNDTALAHGDQGFRDYVTTRGPSLLRAAYVLTGNRADAEDLVQAALAKTYLAWGRIEDRGALDGYVRRAMINTHISWWRRRKFEEYPTDEIPDQAVADHADDSDLQDSLRRAVERLPQRMRAAVVLRYYEDMTEAEVADALGVSLGTVKSTVSRAVAKLRVNAGLLD